MKNKYMILFNKLFSKRGRPDDFAQLRFSGVGRADVGLVSGCATPADVADG
jgi:hypothetical protein